MRGIKQTVEEVICSCAIATSLDLDVCLIVVFTKTGHTALTVAKYRPRAAILAVTEDEPVAKYCTLGHGLYSCVVKNTNKEQQLNQY